MPEETEEELLRQIDDQLRMDGRDLGEKFLALDTSPDDRLVALGIMLGLHAFREVMIGDIVKEREKKKELLNREKEVVGKEKEKLEKKKPYRVEYYERGD